MNDIKAFISGMKDGYNGSAPPDPKDKLAKWIAYAVIALGIIIPIVVRIL